MTYPRRERRLPDYMHTWLRDILRGEDRYGDTPSREVPAQYKARATRRRRNKVARASRKANR